MAPEDPPAKPMRGHQPKRLSVEDWVAAGFRALVSGGPVALKIEPLSRELGTTKGSFYWHFVDAADLRARMLEVWRRLGEAEITDSIRACGLTGKAALEALIERIAIPPPDFFGGAAAEPAIRAWALEDEAVAQAVVEMDAIRIKVLEAFFEEAGAPAPQAAIHAKVFYASFVGLEMLRLTMDVEMDSELKAQLSALISSIDKLQ